MFNTSRLGLLLFFAFALTLQQPWASAEEPRGLHLADDAAQIAFGVAADASLRRAGPSLLAVDGNLAVCGDIVTPPAPLPAIVATASEEDASVASLAWSAGETDIGKGAHLDTGVSPSWEPEWTTFADAASPEPSAVLSVPASGIYLISFTTTRYFNASNTINLDKIRFGASASLPFCTMAADAGFDPIAPLRMPVRVNCVVHLLPGQQIRPSATNMLDLDATSVVARRLDRVAKFNAYTGLINATTRAVGGFSRDPFRTANVDNPSEDLLELVGDDDAFLVNVAGWYRVDLSATIEVGATTAGPMEFVITTLWPTGVVVTSECRMFYKPSASAVANRASTGVAYVHELHTACYLELNAGERVQLYSPSGDESALPGKGVRDRGMQILFTKLAGAAPTIAAIAPHPTCSSSFSYSSFSFASPLWDMITSSDSRPPYPRLATGQSARLRVSADEALVAVDGHPGTKGLYEVDLIFHHEWNLGTASQGHSFDFSVDLWRGKVPAGPTARLYQRETLVPTRCRLRFDAPYNGGLFFDSTFHTTCIVEMEPRDQIFVTQHMSNCKWAAKDVVLLVRQL